MTNRTAPRRKPAPPPAARRGPQTGLLDAARAVLLDLWLRGEPADYTRIAQRLHGRRVQIGLVGRRPSEIRTALVHSLAQHVSRGCAASQRTSHEHSRRALWWLNDTGRPVEETTLADVARAFLVPEVAPAGQQRHLRTALRVVLGLPRLAADPAILAAAVRVPATQLIELPGRVHSAIVAGGGTNKAASNLRAVVRLALRAAAKAKVIPLVWPEFDLPGHDWQGEVDELAPASDRAHLKARHGLLLLGTVARELIDPAITPRTLTRAQATQCLTHIRSVRGDLRGVHMARTGCEYLRRVHGVGPFADGAALDRFVVDTPRGRKPAIALRAADGRADGGSWSRFLEILAEHGLPADTVEALRWHGAYVTQTPEQAIRPGHSFPPLLDRRRLSPTSLATRGQHQRMWIGAALHLLGMAPSDCTPAALYGTRFEQIARALAAWWDDRRTALLDAGQTHGAAQAGGLRQIVVGAGMVAASLYERSRHERGLKVARRQTGAVQRVDQRREEEAAKTPSETAFWDAYTFSMAFADMIASLPAGRGHAGRKGARSTSSEAEFKDIMQIIRETPHTWWIEVLDHMHAEIAALEAAGRDDDRCYHDLVADAFELGMLLTTGMRGQEVIRLTRTPAHLSADADGTRLVRVEAWERKNVKGQSAFVLERFVPASLWKTYTERTIPWRLHGRAEARVKTLRQKVERARTEASRARWRGRLAGVEAGTDEDHGFLLTQRNGKPWGGAPEDRMARRSGAHGADFAQRLAKRAVAAGKRIPEALFHFGRHPIRTAMAFAIYQAQGVIAAANYLGDNPKTVQGTYATTDGSLVDVGAVVDFRTRPNVIGLPSDKPHVAANAAARPFDAPSDDVVNRADLQRMLLWKQITPGEFRDMVKMLDELAA